MTARIICDCGMNVQLVLTPLQAALVVVGIIAAAVFAGCCIYEVFNKKKNREGNKDGKNSVLH